MTTADKPRLFGPHLAYERWRWQTFAITWMAYAGFYLTRKAFSVAKIGIQDDPTFHITKQEMGWIDGANLAAYAFGQFAWGMAGDRLGTRRVILTGMVASIIISFCAGASPYTLMFGVFCVLQGLCQSSGWAPLTKNMSMFFSRHERGLVMGFWCTNYALGGFLASLVAGWAGDQFGWRYAFFIPAIGLGVVWSLFFLFQRNRPEDVGLPPIDEYHRENDEPAIPPKLTASEKPTQFPPRPIAESFDRSSPYAAPVIVLQEPPPKPAPEGSWSTILAVLTNPSVIILGAAYFMIKPARYAMLFWGPLYVNHKLGTNMVASASISGMFEVAGLFGAISGGIISDKLFGSKRTPVCVICLLLLGTLLVFIDGLPANQWILGGALFLMGVLLYAPDTLISGAASMDFGHRKGAATAAGFVNGLGSLGSVIGGLIPGFSEKLGWSFVFYVLCGMIFSSAIILLPLWNATPNKRPAARA